MANGFVTTSPSVRHGSSEGELYVEYLLAQKFTCGGSGTQNVTEIGLWAIDSGTEFRLAIFTDDSGNNCPDTMVANSESATLTSEAAMAKESHTYGTEPQLTGGVDYWLAIFFNGTMSVDYESSSGEDTIYLDFGAPYTWPSGDGWHTHTDAAAYDVGFYAVYEAAVSELTFFIKMALAFATNDIILLIRGVGYAWGEQNPTEEETPSAWSNWSDGSGGTPDILDGASWGKLALISGAIAHSPVIDSGDTEEKEIELTNDKYGTGAGALTLYIRGQAGVFTQDAGSPSWELYSGKVNESWRYIQVRAVG